jgi:outer membrane protein
MKNALLAATALLTAGAAHAQEEPQTRTRVVLGPQLVPTYPGSDKVSLRPFVDVSRAKGDELFIFEAPDESFGFSLFQRDGFAAGPSLGFQGQRDADDVGRALPKVGFTFEAGAFAQYEFAQGLRIRGEVRKGFGGHKGWIGNAGVDYVMRDGDQWLFSLGPRITVTDNRYHDAYFSVAPRDVAASGLPAFNAGGGVQAAGLAAGYLRQLTPRWGISTYAKYDRLVGDAADSPITRSTGSRNQFSGGIAASYTF